MVIVLTHKIEGTHKVFMDAERIIVSERTIEVSRGKSFSGDGLMKFDTTKTRPYCVVFDRKYWQIEERSE